jgi:hypothetical protein
MIRINQALVYVHMMNPQCKVHSSLERLVALARKQLQQLRKISKTTTLLYHCCMRCKDKPRALLHWHNVARPHLHQPPQLSFFKHQGRGVEWGRQQSAHGIGANGKRVQRHETRTSGGEDPGDGVGLQRDKVTLHVAPHDTHSARSRANCFIVSCALQGFLSTHLQPEMQQARQTLKTASASAIEQIALKIQVFQRAVRGEQGEILQRVEAEIEPLQLR